MAYKAKQLPDVEEKILNSLPVAVILFDKKNVYYLNDKAAHIFKFPKNKQKNAREIVLNNYLEGKELKRFNALNAAVLKEKPYESVEFEFKNYKNQTIFLDVSANRVNFQNKNLIQLIFTEVSTIKNKVRETEDLLFKTKEKFDLITNYSNEVIIFYTYYPQEKYLYVSPNIEKILGFKPSELLKDNNFFRKKIAERTKEFNSTDKLLKNYQKNNIQKNHSYFYRITKKNKEQVWIENNFVPIIDNAGKISFFINIIRDITLQKEKELEIELQYTNYRNLLDNSPVAYVIHDHGVCLYVNKALMALFKTRNKNTFLGKFALDFFIEPDRKKVSQRIAFIYSRKNIPNKFINYTILDTDGNEIDVEIKSVLIKFNNKDCILSLVNNLSEKKDRERDKQKVINIETANYLLHKEVKERQEAEKSLMETTAHLSSIFESSTHVLWTVNKAYEVTSFNKNFADIVIQNHGINPEPGLKIDELLTKNNEEYTNYWYTRYAFAFKGRKLEFEKEDNNGGGMVYRKVFINPIYNKKNEVIELSCIANDITDSKIYEQKLLSQTGKLTAIFDSSHHYIWTINQEEKLTSFNKNYYDLITSLYNTKPYVGLMLDRGVLANDREYTMLLKHHYNKAFKGSATSFEIETRDQENKNVYLEIFLNPIYENEKVVEVSGIAHDITEKKHVQQRMEVSLKEKEILLREVHHRVKNNMQVISSILNLQSSYVSDEYTLNLLKESQNRIKTMAYIHESLYQNKSFTSVNFSDYVNTLVNNIVQSYSYSSDKIKLEVNIENMTLSLDSSIPAGLIINELITNAIKHAFPGTRKGTITFNLRCENNLVILELKDDGVGFAKGIDFENSHSLGLQLVNTLTEQIEGEIKFKSQDELGTEVIVTFKM